MKFKTKPNVIWGVKIFDDYHDGSFYTYPLGEKSNKEFQFKLNTSYHIDDPISLCGSGFHYSPSLYEACHYKNLLKKSDMGYYYIAPVCHVMIPKNATIDTNIFDGYVTFPCSKFATSDIIISSTINLYTIFDCIVNFKNLITHQSTVMTFFDKYNKCFIEDSLCQCYFTDNFNIRLGYTGHYTIDKNIDKITTIFVRGIEWREMYVKNESDYTSFINLIYPDTQYIFKIPSHSSVCITTTAKENEKHMVKIIKYI